MPENSSPQKQDNTTGKLVLCMIPQMPDGDGIPWKKWPMSIDEAAEEVLLHLSEETKTEVANTPRGYLVAFHQCLGMFVRNNLGLWAYKGWPDPGEAEVTFQAIVQCRAIGIVNHEVARVGWLCGTLSQPVRATFV